MKYRSVARWFEYAFFAAGAVLLGYCVYSLGEARIFQAGQAGRFERASKEPPAALPWPADLHLTPRPPALAGPLAPALHEVIARLDVPRIHLSTVVLEGDDSRSLRLGAGHIPGTTLPGERGNVAIAAHRDTYFRSLRDIAPNDEIDLTTIQHRYRYRVTSVEVVSPRAVSVLESRGAPELTLVTCYPFRFVGPAPRRFIVHARLAG